MKKLTESTVETLFPDEHLFLSVNASVTIMRHLAKAKLKNEFKGLLSLPGIGETLALTIMLEVGDIKRFPEAGDYSSYCRCVKSTRSSNGKSKRQGNRKNGNAYLSWAYVEAANKVRRYYPIINRYYQKKMSQTNQAVAIKAINNKLARATYYVLRDQAVYDKMKLFGGKAEPEKGVGS